MAHLSVTINTQDKTLGCELYVPREKKLFAALADRKEAIEKEFGEALEWMELPGKKASRIKVSRDATAKSRNQVHHSIVPTAGGRLGLDGHQAARKPPVFGAVGSLVDIQCLNGIYIFRRACDLLGIGLECPRTLTAPPPRF